MVWRGCVIANEDPARQASKQVTWPESWRGGDVSKGETTGGDGFGGPGECQQLLERPQGLESLRVRPAGVSVRVRAWGAWLLGNRGVPATCGCTCVCVCVYI